MPQIREIPEGTLGFDCNTSLTDGYADKFFKKGYRFVMRYVTRSGIPYPYDITAAEIALLHKYGLAVGLVQHVENEKIGWFPSPQKGINYGATASNHAEQVGYPKGGLIWLDLENVNKETPPMNIVRYCNNWYHTVNDLGYTPGIYVGWHTYLTSKQMFVNLAFQHYWGAYNLDSDEEPWRRGLQMKQHEITDDDRPEGISINFKFDRNTVKRDELGGLPLVYAPDEWSVSNI